MDKLMFEALPQLVATCPIAARLVDIVQATHNASHLIVDVRPDNWMLAKSDSMNASIIKPEDFANSIRMIDLGLLRGFKNAAGHKPNEGTGQVQETFLYCSLSVHKHNTPSRRDDIEAMLYLLGAMVIIVANICEDENASTKPDSALPWRRISRNRWYFVIRRSYYFE